MSTPHAPARSEAVSRPAFTLIELLVVIAIISILASILFPVFSKAREQARKASCLSNEKQLTMACLMYTQDYDEELPNAADGGPGGGQIGGWVYYQPGSFPANLSPGSYDVTQGSLWSYTKSRGIYVCPDDSEGRRSGDSYSINSCTLSIPKIGGVRVGKVLGAFDNTAGFMLFSEEASYDRDYDSTDDGYLLYPENIVSARHTNGSNISFVDGHAKWYRVEKIEANEFRTGDPARNACP